MRYIKTNKYVINIIHLAHSKELIPFASCTCPEGNMILGEENPYIMTEWGFEDAEFPTYKIVQTKESKEQKEWNIEYFLSAPTNKNCEFI